MPPKKAEPAVKRGRGRPPKSATTPAKESATTTATPSKRGRGRPPKTSTTPKTAAVPASPAKQRGRPAKSDSKKPGRPSHQKAPATIPSAGIKKRGRPAGSTNAKKASTAPPTQTKAPPGTGSKGGRPKGKHVSNLSASLKRLIDSASKGRLVELLSALCDRNATVAKATTSALREEKIRSEGHETGGGDIVVEAENALLQAEGYEKRGEGDVLVFSKGHGPGKTNGVGRATGKAKVNRGVNTTVEKGIYITVDHDQQVHTELGTEPKSGYEADVELEIPATATEAGDGEGISQEDAPAETETIAQAVSSMRDSAFAL